MMDDRVDLSPLDPERDPAHFEALVGAVLARVRGRRAFGLAAQIVAWAKPSLAAAAMLAVVVWGASLLGAGPTPARAEDPAYALLSWAATSEQPAAASVLTVLGGVDERSH